VLCVYRGGGVGGGSLRVYRGGGMGWFWSGGGAGGGQQGVLVIDSDV